MGQQLVLRTVLRRSKNNFRNQNSCFLLKSHLVIVFRGINPHLSNAISQQPLNYWQKCYSLNLSETKTLGGLDGGGLFAQICPFVSIFILPWLAGDCIR